MLCVCEYFVLILSDQTLYEATPFPLSTKYLNSKLIDVDSQFARQFVWICSSSNQGAVSITRSCVRVTQLWQLHIYIVFGTCCSICAKNKACCDENSASAKCSVGTGLWAKSVKNTLFIFLFDTLLFSIVCLLSISNFCQKSKLMGLKPTSIHMCNLFVHFYY